MTRPVVVSMALLTAAGLVAASPTVAFALTPPVVDARLLPAAAVPAPPRPSMQHQPCPTLPHTTTTARSTDLLAPVRQLSQGDGQRVAVIDTGVVRHHRLAHVEAGGDYVSTGDGTADCDGHGTLVAGIIAATPDADDRSGFVGIAPAATVLAIRQSSAHFSPAGSATASGSGDVTTMAAAVRTAADLGATVINISTVACGTGPLRDGALGAALAYAVDVKDVVVVAAAGNVGGAGRCPRPSGGDDITWATATVVTSPGWYDDLVLTVGSVGPDGMPSEFSLPGPWVDLAAPGEQVVSLHPDGIGLVAAAPTFGRAAPISGTSYAAPVVSGLAALVRARFPELTARQVMQRIESTARPVGAGWNPLTGNGIVDPVAALSDDAAPSQTPSAPSSITPGIEADLEPAPADSPARATALLGAAGCGLALCVSAVLSRSRRREFRQPDPIPGGQCR